MRIGLVTDVHNHAAELARALAAFERLGVDRVLTIGDTIDAFGPPAGATEVAALLTAAGAVGVWGNHDFNLCRDVPERMRGRFEPGVLDFLARMEPWLVLDGCRFTHKEACADPHDVAQLWAVDDGPLDLDGRARESFAAVSERRLFVGHYHQWWAGTPAGPVGWVGEGPLTLADGERYFVVVAPVCEGWCGLLDTSAGVLEPVRCGDPLPGSVNGKG